MGAREVGEAGDGGAGDLADGAREIEGGADQSADLVEEFQPFADRRVLQVECGVGRGHRRVGVVAVRGTGARRAGLRRAVRVGRSSGDASRHTPVGGDGDPVVVAELQYGIAEFEDLGDDALRLGDAHVRQDVRELAGQRLGVGEFGVQREARRYPAAVGVAHVAAELVDVRGEYEMSAGPRPGQRVGPPQHVEPGTSRFGELGPAGGRVGAAPVQLRAQFVVGAVRVVGAVDPSRAVLGERPETGIRSPAGWPTAASLEWPKSRRAPLDQCDTRPSASTTTTASGIRPVAARPRRFRSGGVPLSMGGRLLPRRRDLRLCTHGTAPNTQCAGQ